MVSTISDEESVACQQLVDVDASGMFQVDVAVNNDFQAWSVLLTDCVPGKGKGKDSRCRMMDVSPPGEHSGDYCHPVANQTVPSEQDHPDKTHYVAKVDFGVLPMSTR